MNIDNIVFKLGILIVIARIVMRVIECVKENEFTFENFFDTILDLVFIGLLILAIEW